MSVFLSETNIQEVTSNFLLGNSQTFIGVLVTLVVLYLYSSESNGNFFVSFVKHLGDEAREVISQYITVLSDNVDSQFWNNDEEKDEGIFFQKTLDPIIKSGDKGKGEAKALKQELLLTLVNVQKIPVNFLNKFTPLTIEVDKRMNNLAKAIEFEFIALYTFFFSVLVFSIDCLFQRMTNFGLYFLYAFTISSSLFVLIIWINLWKKTGQNFENKNSYEKDTSRKSFLFWIKILLLFIIIPSLAIIGGDLIDSYFINLVFVSIIYGICFFLGGGIHFYKIKNSHKYNRHFVLSHFVYLFIAALCVVLFCIIFSSTILDISLFNTEFLGYVKAEHYKNLKSFKEVLVLFIVLNGVVIPFMLSYARSKVIRFRVERSIEKGNKEALEEIKRQKEAYGDTVRKIKELIKKQ